MLKNARRTVEIKVCENKFFYIRASSVISHQSHPAFGSAGLICVFLSFISNPEPWQTGSKFFTSFLGTK